MFSEEKVVQSKINVWKGGRHSRRGSYVMVEEEGGEEEEEGGRGGEGGLMYCTRSRL